MTWDPQDDFDQALGDDDAPLLASVILTVAWLVGRAVAAAWHAIAGRGASEPELDAQGRKRVGL